MHRLFRSFIDGLANSGDSSDLRAVLSEAASAMDLSCFAYLALPTRQSRKPQLISTYPASWIDFYLRNHYERLDPVIAEVLRNPEPFEWGFELSHIPLTASQNSLLDEAAHFGIRCGFTVPIHDSSGLIAAVTFAADERRPTFQRCVAANRHVLQLMAMYFHAHARRKLSSDRIIDGVSLSPRELECLEWAAQGKSCWEIGRILGISRRTAAFHLDNVRTKLGVCTIRQAVARLAAYKSAIN